MRRLVVLALLLGLAGCGGSSDSASDFQGEGGQERYCHAQGWDYEPATNDCKVKVKP